MKRLFDKTRILRSVALLVALLTLLTSCAELEAILGDFLPFGTSAGSTVPNLPESDVNANSLAQGARTMTFTALGIPNMPLFGSKDAERFFEICGEKYD